MAKEFNNFEEQIKSAMESYEVPYSEQSWNAIESHLDIAAASNTSTGMLAAIFTGVAVIGTSLGIWIYSGNYEVEALGLTKTLKVEKNLSYEGIESKYQEKEDVAADVVLIEKKKAAPKKKSKRKEDIIVVKEDATAFEEQRKFEKEELKSTPLEIEKTENELDFVASVREACVGSEISFELGSQAVEGAYLWNFGDGNFSSKANPTHAFKKSGVYDISLSITSAEDGMMRSQSIKNMVVVNPKPEASFDWELISEEDELPTVKFTNTSDKAHSCEWEFDMENSSVEINPLKSYRKEGKHAVKLIVKNEFGCEDSHHEYVNIDADFNLAAAKTLSLSDAKELEVFLPEALKSGEYNFKFTVYNGKQAIYETSDSKKGWNGMLSEGNLAEVSTSYPWVVIIYDQFQQEVDYYSGTITIEP